MTTPRRFVPHTLVAFAACLALAASAEARPRIAWSTPSQTSPELGPGGTVYVGTNTRGSADPDNTMSIWSVDQGTGVRTRVYSRTGYNVVNTIATRAFTFSSRSPRTLYAVASTPGRLLAINPDNGQTLWEATTSSSDFTAETALTSQSNVVLPVDGRGVGLLRRTNGRTSWFRTDLDFLSPDAPVVGSGGRLFVHAGRERSGSTQTSLFSLDVDNGRTNWLFSTGLTEPASQPVLGPKGLVFVSGNRVFAVNSSTGKLVWGSATGRFSKPVVASDNIVVVATTRQLIGFRTKTGSRAWVRSISTPNCDPVLTDNGLILIGTGGFQLEAYDAKSGKRRWRLSTSGIVRDIAVRGSRYFCATSQAADGPITRVLGLRD